jgi:hypothetical protein
MAMKKKITMLAMSVLAGVSMTLGFVTPASAAYADCNEGVFCAWDGANYGNPIWKFSQTAYGPINACNTLTASNGNNDWSAFKNKFQNNLGLYVYSGANCSGTRSPIYPRDGAQLFTGNYDTSSFRIVRF